MSIFENFLLVIGGITLFILGLKFMSQNMENLTGKILKNLMRSCTKNRFSGLLTGAISTSVVQSSVATNIILVSFVSGGVITFYNSCAVIMGTNIGTTITAQLVSLSSGGVFNITAVSSLIAFIGLLLSFSKKTNLYSIGNVLIGFGLLFVGIDIIKSEIYLLKNYSFFCNIFLVDSDILLLLNGIFITAIVQSSSIVSSIIVLLASGGLLTFEKGMFLILGSNVGTCLCVILVSMNKNIEGQKTAFFNLLFNLFGSLILFIPLSLFKSQVANFFTIFSGNVERSIANFHTLFNVFISVIFMIGLRPIADFVDYLFSGKKPKNYSVLGVKNAVK